MEGILHVPPDRGTIIGRAIWKARYVVVAAPSEAKQRLQQQRRQQTPVAGSSSVVPPKSSSSISRSQQAQPPRATTPHSPSSLTPETMFLSIFKNKGDCEPIQQHAISSITDCQVQMLAHRKQGPILPTLVISISPDPITDKLRKRRSSRTAGLTTTKETSPTTLWFRPAEDSHQKHILQDWCRFIQSLIPQLGSATPSAAAANAGLSGPLSPITPASPTFVNPFASSQRPGSDNNATGRTNALSHKASNQTTQTNQTSQTYSSRERERDRPKTYSESPSLRSRRSDLSHTSSNLPPHVTTPGYSSSSSNNNTNNFALPFFQSRPADLPSPATTVNEFQSDFIEGWTSAQGRSSTLSSPIRGRDSISSQPPLPMAVAVALPATAPGPASSSSPPVPRETILDRAFQMRFIPGSDRDVPGEGKLSSLARFDALMREVDERKRLRQAIATSDIKRSATAAPTGRPEPQLKSGWDLDDDDEESDDADDSGGDGEDDNEDEDSVHSGDDEFSDSDLQRRNGRRADSSSVRQNDHLDSAIEIAPSARRALDFIAGRHRDAERDSRAVNISSKQQQSQSVTSSALRAFEASSITPKARAGILDYDAQTLRTLDSGYYPSSSSTQQQQQQQLLLRPQTGYSRSRPAIAQRTHSQPQLAALNVGIRAAGSKHGKSPISPSSPPPLPRSLTSSKIDDVKAKTTVGAVSSPSASLHPSATPAAISSPPTSGATLDKRQSTSSIKRLSFTDFTKRLSSSTSSLLLVQTNASSNSGSGNVSGNASGNGSVIHEADTPTGTVVGSPRSEKPTAGYSYANTNSPGHQHSSSTSSRLSSPPPPPPVAEQCGWRGSVSVISTEGGFL